MGIPDKGLSFVKGPQYLHFVIEHFEIFLHTFDVCRFWDNNHTRLDLKALYHLAYRLVIAVDDILQYFVIVDSITELEYLWQKCCPRPPDVPCKDES